MARHYERHKKDARSGARVSYSTESYGDGQTIMLATVTRGARRWRKRAKTKGELELWAEEKLLSLEQEGVTAAELTLEERRDALAAKQLLLPGESLSDAARDLLAVRDLLGTGTRLGNALEEIREARNRLAPKTISDGDVLG